MIKKCTNTSSLLAICTWTMWKNYRKCNILYSKWANSKHDGAITEKIMNSDGFSPDSPSKRLKFCNLLSFEVVNKKLANVLKRLALLFVQFLSCSKVISFESFSLLRFIQFNGHVVKEQSFLIYFSKYAKTYYLSWKPLATNNFVRLIPEETYFEYRFLFNPKYESLKNITLPKIQCDLSTLFQSHCQT